MKTLLLASASPARAALLRSAGVQPLIQVADVDEPTILADAGRRRGAPLPAEQAVLVLAQAKAERVAAHPNPHLGAPGTRIDAVLGCDSLLEFEGQIWGKPGTPERARERWRQLRGGTAKLHTGHWLIDSRGRCASASRATTLRFADISDEEIEAYIATGEPLAVAGGFTIDGLGGAFISHIDGDFHAVVGLSIHTLRELTAELGLRWIDFWAEPNS